MGGTGRRQEGMGQRGFGFAAGPRRESAAVAESEAGLFLDPDRSDLFFGEQRIDRYLIAQRQTLAVGLRALLRGLDYGLFARQYSRHGRKALHPCTLLGLIVYATLKGRGSLREMEELAQVDLGAMWLCGGHLPDHSTIGKFVQLHRELVGEGFFTGLLRSLLSRLGVKAGVVAADGTVIEAAASRLRLIKAEAAHLAAQGAHAAAARAPADGEAAQRAAAAQELSAQASARSERRAQQGASAAETRLAPSEPEAVLQRLKGGGARPAYKPSLAVHESGLIVGHYVDPSSERSAVMPMLKQHQAIFDAPPTRLLLDGGYPSLALFRQLYELELDVLAPSGATRGRWERRGRYGRFAKSAFHYQPQSDRYRCPAGRELVRVGSLRDRTGPYHRYRGTQCADCELRARCTSSKQGRALNRYPDDELKEAMSAVLQQPAARRAYRQRTMVERAIARLRQRGLRRFRRRGLRAVRVEFALHCIAYNLGWALRGRLWLTLCARTRSPIGDWHLLALVAVTC
jgi:transposase